MAVACNPIVLRFVLPYRLVRLKTQIFMKKIFTLLSICLLLLQVKIIAQNCGTIYACGYTNNTAPNYLGVRSYNPATSTWSALLETSTLFTNPHKITKGGPLAIDPLNQNINFLTDVNTPPYSVALFTFGGAVNFYSFPASLNSYNVRPLCSGYKNNSHICYYMSANFLSTSPVSPPGTGFYSIDFTTPTAPIAKIYTCTLAPGSPVVNTSTGGDLCFDLNGTAYLVTGANQLYTITTNETASTATFSLIANLGLSFAPIAVTFDPANSNLIVAGTSATAIAEYNLSNNTIVPSTPVVGYNTSDLASCFYPNINPALKFKKTVYDSTQHMGAPVTIMPNDIVTYTITVADTGNVNAGGFILTDTIPAGTTYVAGSTRMNSTAVADGTGSTFPFQKGLAANSKDQPQTAPYNGIITTNATTNTTPANPVCTITYNVKVTATNGTVVTNTAVASVSGSSLLSPILDTAYAGFTVGSVLAVKFLNFTANTINNSVLLQWQTAEEINTNNYIIEKSTDGSNFTAIGSVAALGISGNGGSYNFSDNNLNNNIIYYRIKEVDKDGSATYSWVVVARLNAADKLIIKLSPNPVTAGRVQLSLGAAYKKLQVRIVDVLGQALWQQNFNNVSNTLMLNLNNLSKGMYYVTATGDGTPLQPAKLLVE